MKRYRVSSVSTLLLALLAAAFAASASDGNDKLCPDPLFGGPNLEEWQGDEILFLLGLSGEQTAQIDAIKAAYERARSQNLQRLEQLTGQLESLSPDSADFDATVSAIARERAELVGEQVRQRIRMVAAIQAALEPEQRVLLEQKMTERLRHQTLMGAEQASRPQAD